MVLQLIKMSEQTIAIYLDNEEKRYQDWYRSLEEMKTGSELTPVSPIPSLKNLKNYFSQWISEYEDVLRFHVCEKWNYNKHKDSLVNASLIASAGIIDAVATAFNNLPTNTFMVAVSIILIESKYFDKLCDYQNKEGE